MRSRNFSVGLTAVAIVALAMLGTPTRAAAQTEAVLHSFSGSGQRSSEPYAGLVADKAGNLYGTTTDAGYYGPGGTVFELTHKPGGGWIEKTLHEFTSGGVDGFVPYGGVILDSAGNLYGTTYYGGANGAGIVFELLPQADGRWRERILYNFSATGGTAPTAGLIADAKGNLYGTAPYAGTNQNCYGGCGTVFELTPTPTGGWAQKTLFNFDGGDGSAPFASLILDKAGNLYSTTDTGGAHNQGTAFQLMPGAGGIWTETVLHSFGGGTDGQNPTGGLIVDSLGNLYGTTFNGGAYNYGSVYELMPQGGGTWNEMVLHSFNFAAGDGFYPNYGSLILDASGNVYGTTTQGGSGNFGAVFELVPAGGGTWTETILWSFNMTDGWIPEAGLIADRSGNLYGTTKYGGSSFGGTVFEIKP
jgi:uncharacterized repeat protein (TIGR03803 family)